MNLLPSTLTQPALSGFVAHAAAISAVAGDDHTLCLAAYGYGSFEKLQNSFRARYEYLQQHYLAVIADLPLEDRDSRYTLWQTYQKDYLRYI